MPKTEKTSTATVRFEDDVIWVVYHAGAEETLETAKELRESMERVGEGPSVGVLVDIRHLKASTREARKFWAAEDGDGSAVATAVLVARGVTSAFGNFWLAVSGPAVPTRLFTDEAAALEWLKRYLHSSE